MPRGRRRAGFLALLLGVVSCRHDPSEPAPSPTASASANPSGAETAAPVEAGLTIDVQPIEVPLVRFGAAAAVDSARARFFIWGGGGAPADAGARPEGANPKLLEVVWLGESRRSTVTLGGAAPAGVFVPAMAHDPYGNGLYVFGGWAKDKKGPSDGLVRIDTAGDGYMSRPFPKTGRWPAARNGASLVSDSMGNALWLFGGDGGPGGAKDAKQFTPLGDLWRFDLDAQRWDRIEDSGDRPPARWHAAMTVDETGRKAYLFGGAGVEPDAFDARLYELGLTTSTWSLVRATGDAPPSLQGATLTFDPEMRALVLVGGLRHLPPGPAVASEIWLMDLDRKRWSHIDGGAKVARRDHVAGYDTATRAHYVFGGRVSQTLGDFYEVGEPVTGALRIRVKRSP